MISSERLIIRDRAGCMGLLGLMFFSGGVLVLTMLLLGKLGPERRTWEILAVAAIGLAHFSVGGWLLASTPGMRINTAPRSPRSRVAKKLAGAAS